MFTLMQSHYHIHVIVCFVQYCVLKWSTLSDLNAPFLPNHDPSSCSSLHLWIIQSGVFEHSRNLHSYVVSVPAGWHQLRSCIYLQTSMKLMRLNIKYLFTTLYMSKSTGKLCFTQNSCFRKDCTFFNHLIFEPSDDLPDLCWVSAVRFGPHLKVMR